MHLWPHLGPGPVIEPLSVGLALFAVLYGLIAVCHQIAWWSARTPRSGYLILAILGLYLLARTLP